jgi:hypothetical protein
MAQGTQTGNTQQNLVVTNMRMFQPESRPYALLGGRSVRIIGEGDVEGKSPCFRYVGPDLKISWESQNKFTVIDPGYLPASEQALAILGHALTDATSQGTGR